MERAEVDNATTSQFGVAARIPFYFGIVRDLDININIVVHLKCVCVCGCGCVDWLCIH